MKHTAKKISAGHYAYRGYRVFSVLIRFASISRKEWRIETSLGDFVNQCGSLRLAKHIIDLKAKGTDQ